ncbi:DNRLRE domain-containing protein [Paenibacillus tianjinensis]|uniref:DNRLRE domain-containing protein n=1 Tax=Paenibacillus tianjinensis TaxID=2810347 RepID=A0ABX7L605_9BACL|nr:DNRLRE domain-containing protein [Paenibacillus tianjinensis]QSF43568.1 DNRLRE domain-containing protein [Paenibacillus tianjinensis]
MDEIDEISSVITIKNRFANQLAGSFKLYRPMTDDIDAEITIKKNTGDDLRSIIEIRNKRDYDFNSLIDIVYRGTNDTVGQIEAVAAKYIDAMIEVRPHNRMFGKFELMGAPKKSVSLSPIADATTRSREDLRTINYGDTRSMLTGKTTDETFGAFVQFADFANSIPDLKFIESAKLRLYYTNLHSGANIELHQPNTIWREFGITDANKPHSIEKLNDTYTANTAQRYIEFDVKDVATRWQNGLLNNFGFIVSTMDDARYTFFTRESDYPPQLIVDYVTSQVYSVGRSELEGGLFVYGRGHKDVSAVLTVDSDVGIENLISYIYVHRATDYMQSDIDTFMSVSKPDLFSTLTVQNRDFTDLDASITVDVRTLTDLDSSIGINNPDIDSWLTVDSNMSLTSYIDVPAHEFMEAFITVSQPDLGASLTISNHIRANGDTDSTLTVRTEYETTIDSYIATSTPDLPGTMYIRAIADSAISGMIDVPSYTYLDSTIGYSHPDLSASLTVKYVSDIESEIYIKEKEYLDMLIDVKKISEISGVLMVKAFNQIDGEITINNPELFGLLSPRVTGENNLDAEILIKKRNVADLNSYISVRGQGNRNFVIMF